MTPSSKKSFAQLLASSHAFLDVLRPMPKSRPAEDRFAPTAIALLVATGGLSLTAQGAMAQSVTDGGLGRNLTRNSETGAVRIDNNSFIIQTGPLTNTSNIPLPSALPAQVIQRQPIPVDRSRLAPNTLEFTTNSAYIEGAFEDAIGGEAGYVLNVDSLQLTTEFDVNQRVGDHAFGEGIEAIVVDGNGNEISREAAFVRGGRVRIGPNGQTLPQSDGLSVTYTPKDTVKLRVLNLRQDNAAPSESGLYFTQGGELIAEDLQNGGDLDFNDGDYLDISGGSGQAEVIEEQIETTVAATTVETPLDPLTVERIDVEEDMIQTVQEMDSVSEEVIEYGEVDAPDSRSPRLGHARGVRAQTGEQLIYNRYAAANEVRAGSDGLGFTGQLAPLIRNPSVPPTLLTGNVTYNPFVDDNEAGLTVTAGLTQFLNPTHRQARDVFGNEIVNPDGSDRRLLEPTGLFNNRRLVGYVPALEPEEILGGEIGSVDGIFDLPADLPVVVAPPDADQVGRGNAAYTNNVGGLLIEGADGGLSFVPQWTVDGYAQEPLSLAAGEATRLIYALVPQQAGQDLQLGQRYAVNSAAETYQIADGGFTIISADRQPQNFAREMAEVYAVEDTIADRQNASTENFNGVQGNYVEQFGGVRVPTVDVEIASEVDARVGNTLFPVEAVVTDPGQGAYVETTVAAGFYLGGTLTGGIGNQENVISRTESSMTVQTDELRIRESANTFEIPRTQVETTTSGVDRITRRSGTALFDINENGVLTNAQFLEGALLSVEDTASRPIGSEVSILTGEERFVNRRVLSEEFILMDSQVTMGDTVNSIRRESRANFAPVRGELTLGGVMNFGNTPWTLAANTVRAELFARDTVFGRGSDGSDVGWRAEAIFHPFGEVQRDAYQYDAAGNVVPVYQTQAVVDADGKQVMETLVGLDNEQVEVPVNAFRLDELGERMLQTVGTGVSSGPGVYLRVEDAFDDGDSVQFAGGVKFNF